MCKSHLLRRATPREIRTWTPRTCDPARWDNLGEITHPGDLWHPEDRSNHDCHETGGSWFARRSRDGEGLPWRESKLMKKLIEWNTVRISARGILPKHAAVAVWKHRGIFFVEQEGVEAMPKYRFDARKRETWTWWQLKHGHTWRGNNHQDTFRTLKKRYKRFRVEHRNRMHRMPKGRGLQERATQPDGIIWAKLRIQETCGTQKIAAIMIATRQVEVGSQGGAEMAKVSLGANQS